MTDSAEAVGNTTARVVSPAIDLPPSLQLEQRGRVALVTLSRPQKRNALDDATVQGLERIFSDPPRWAKSAVIDAQGDHFSAGLDLSELPERDSVEGLHHSRMWHRAFAAIEHGTIPVVSALHGAVIGGGLELASATHIRVADESTFYALPEGQRGLFVGGGGSVRLPKLIGAHRMADMMLTGRVIDAQEAQIIGLSQYLVAAGEASEKALEIAAKIAENAPMTNFAVLQALPRIANASPSEGYLLEALMASVAGSSEDARSRIGAFLDGKAEKVRPNGDGGRP